MGTYPVSNVSKQPSNVSKQASKVSKVSNVSEQAMQAM